MTNLFRDLCKIKSSPMNLNLFRIIAMVIMLTFSANLILHAQNSDINDYTVSKPFTRWWWFSSDIDLNVIRQQLDWVKANEFGGVEIAWVYPYDRDTVGKRILRVWHRIVAKMPLDWGGIVRARICFRIVVTVHGSLSATDETRGEVK